MTPMTLAKENEGLTQIIRNAFDILSSNLITHATQAPDYPDSESTIEKVGALIRNIDDLLGYLETNATTTERKQVLLMARTMRQAAYALMAAINPVQAWFWTEEWQAGEREADRDIATGNLLRFDSDEAFDRALDAADAMRG